MRRIVPVLIFLIAILIVPAFAQRIQAKVEVTLDKLPMENQRKLQDLQAQLERYVNGYEWCPNDYNYTVPVTVNIYFEEAKATSLEDRYEARLIISNESDIQYSDYRWDFDLDPHPQLKHTPTFDAFTGMIDFYLSLILGFEFDRIEKLGGRDYFQKARNILELAKFSRFARGWDRREDILNGILAPANQPNREMKFYYYTGIYYYNAGELEDAKPYLMKAISYFRTLPPSEMERFYSLNYHSMGEVLQKLLMKNELELLMELDPSQEHKDYYRSLWEEVNDSQE
jgi:hypothetical protein